MNALAELKAQGKIRWVKPITVSVGEIQEVRGLVPVTTVQTRVVAQETTVIPIPSGRTPEHVRDAVGAAEVALWSKDLTAIDRAESPTN